MVCGICGQFNFRQVPLEAAPWETLVDAMWRRGPDDRGLWHDSRCLLGSRRLSILDPSQAGHQPMRTADGRQVLVWNGELYNFRQLRRELQGLGHRFRSQSDSEVALEALRRWGTEALDRFNGMFALAFYDAGDQALILARDHAGIKPLYYLEHPDGLIFASQFDQIEAHPWARSRRHDPQAVAMYLRLGYIPAPLAFLEGTHMLEPGGWLRARVDGTIDKERYFTFPRRRRVSDESREPLDAVIERAVLRQTVSDVPLGCFLSGGVDSPLVAACVAGGQSHPVPTFSIAVDGPGLDESADAGRFAELLATEHHVQALGQTQVLELFQEALDATHEPLADEAIFPSLVVSRLARSRVKVALSGDGGDELFWGYFRRNRRILQEVSGPGRKGDGSGVGDPGAAPGNRVGSRFLESFAEFRRDQFEACFPQIPWWPSDHPFYAFDPQGWDETSDTLRWCEFTAYLPFHLLKTDRASMHHSLEVRVPLLDRELVERAASFGAKECIDLERGLGKLPLRSALGRRVDFSTQKKRGFTVSMDDWIRGPLRDAMSESLGSLRGLESVDVDRKALHGLFERHLTGEENNGMALFRLLMLDRWLAKVASARAAA